MSLILRDYTRLTGALCTLGFIACASFGGEEGSSSSSSGSPNPNGQDGGPVVVATPGSLAVSFASTVRLTQGASAKVHVKVAREGLPGTVTITGKNLPEGVGLVPLELKEGVSEGDLELSASATAKQGDASGAMVVARSAASTTADSAMSLFVRGAPGSPDTTYAANGSVDLGEVGYAMRAAANETQVYLLTNTTLRRYRMNGERDAAFPETTVPADVRDMRVHTNGDVFLVTSGRTVTKILANGTRDASFGVGGEAGPFGFLGAYFPGIALNASGQVFFTYTVGVAKPSQLIRLTATGGEDPAFTYTAYSRGSQSKTSINQLIGNADGTTTAAISSLDGAAVFQRIGADGASLEIKETPTTDNVYLADAIKGKTEIFALHLPETYIDRAIMRFDLALVRDYTFGTDGFARLPPYVSGGGGGIAFIPDAQNRVVAVCSTRIAGNDQLVISRFQPNGKPDTSFAPSGFHTTPSAKSDYLFVRVADPERIVVSGLADTHAFIARFWM